MTYIILIMSVTTASWELLWPEIFHWDNLTDCKYFLEHDLIRYPGFIYECAEDGR